MARYIDADIALEKMKNWHTQERLMDCVRDTPTADVVEVRDYEQCIHSSKHLTEYHGVMTYNNDRNELINLINILSFMVGLENIQENRIQSAQNDVQMANDKQAKYLLEEINRRFDEQNELLRNIQKSLNELNGGD